MDATEGVVDDAEADYHTDYPTEEDCKDSDYEGDDKSASSEDDGDVDVESQRETGNLKRKLEESTWQGTGRSLKRACKERGIRRVGLMN